MQSYAMLNDGWQRSEGGERVVVGWIEHHDRAETGAQLRNLEIVPPRSVAYRGRTFGELDVAAIVAGRPDVVLIDELAHTNVDGVRKRWEDAAELLATRLSVMTTVNIANLLLVRDYAAPATGTGMVESVPDEFVQSGEWSSSTWPLRRSASGSPPGGCTPPTEWAAHWPTTSVHPTSPRSAGSDEPGWQDRSMRSPPVVLARQGVGPLAARPTVVAGVSGSAWGENVIRRPALLAAEDDADLLVGHM
ncbi:MAG TPA: hypothetical protein VFI46_01025, partial [Jiangellaceae bacterium]|nr:hypothetical protein [Jiangellaceae bacterium]